MSGQLALVATPIGNLGDISARAAAQLRQADRILAEDTRRARVLLNHLCITGCPIDRLDSAVEKRSLNRCVARLNDGERVVLVTDAGTPTVSDPGYLLVRACAEASIALTVIPGPSAVMAALAVSGFPASTFRFFGFLSRQGVARQGQLTKLRDTAETAVLFEAPPRMASTLAELSELMPAREAMLAREITKVHEQFLRGSLVQLQAAHGGESWRGELTIVLGPYDPPVSASDSIDETELDKQIDTLLGQGRRAKEIAKALSLKTGIPTSELYLRVTARRRRE